MAAFSSIYKGVIARAVNENDCNMQELISSTQADALKSDGEKREAVESAFREVLFDILSSASCGAADTNQLSKLVDMAIDTSKADLTTVSMPHRLLEDIFDMAILDVCETMFSFMELRTEVWSTAPFTQLKSRQDMLKICNALKKRLSKNRDTVLSGRILIFLASVTPLSDKSGVNQGSIFNSTNVTTFEDEPTEGDEDENSGDKAATEEESAAAALAAENDKPTDAPVDFVFYRRFWSLQRFFLNPMLCYNREQWENCVACIQAVMNAFQSYKLDRYEGRICTCDIILSSACCCVRASSELSRQIMLLNVACMNCIACNALEVLYSDVHYLR
eukprot:m.301159 g.301159  ORF g.301159 m.301159 type:complete len:333 (-) comp20136_c0_seq9:3495-4493(-)